MPQNRKITPFHTNLFKWIIAVLADGDIDLTQMYLFCEDSCVIISWKQTLKARPTNSSARNILSIFLSCLI